MRTRREVLAAVGGAGVVVLGSSRAAFGFAANERLNLAIVGVAGYAAAAAFVPAIHIYPNVGITALCDVDQRKVKVNQIWKERAEKLGASEKPEERRGAEVYRRLVEMPPRMWADYRRMIEDGGKDFDAVVVATPDHSHAAPSAYALRAGKHAFCEKPLTVTVQESRALVKLARDNPALATSMGNQGTQSGPFRRGLELIREGALGDVTEVHVWFDRGGRNIQKAPEGTRPVPPELNWDLWLGPVKWREYHPEWIARTHWRDTGAGELGNFGPHTANLAFMALDVAKLWESGGAPGARIDVEAECSGVNRLSFPAWERIRWHVPARGQMKPFTMTWHQGPKLPPGSRDQIEKLMRDRGATDDDVKKLLLYAGAVIVGGKGMIVTDSHNVNVTLLPKGPFADVKVDKPLKVEASRGHYRDWIDACRGTGPGPWSRFEHAGVFNDFLMLGDVATRWPGETLSYDPVGGRITNHADAHATLGYEYRQGWRLL